MATRRFNTAIKALFDENQEDRTNDIKQEPEFLTYESQIKELKLLKINDIVLQSIILNLSRIFDNLKENWTRDKIIDKKKVEDLELLLACLPQKLQQDNEEKELEENNYNTKINEITFFIIILNTSSHVTREPLIKKAQLIITYYLMFYLKLRINSLLKLNYYDLTNMFETKTLKVLGSKKNDQQYEIKLDSDLLKLLEPIKPSLEFFFITSNKEFLGSSTNYSGSLLSAKCFRDNINDDLFSLYGNSLNELYKYSDFF